MFIPRGFMIQFDKRANIFSDWVGKKPPTRSRSWIQGAGEIPPHGWLENHQILGSDWGLQPWNTAFPPRFSYKRSWLGFKRPTDKWFPHLIYIYMMYHYIYIYMYPIALEQLILQMCALYFSNMLYVWSTRVMFFNKGRVEAYCWWTKSGQFRVHSFHIYIYMFFVREFVHFAYLLFVPWGTKNSRRKCRPFEMCNQSSCVLRWEDACEQSENLMIFFLRV